MERPKYKTARILVLYLLQNRNPGGGGMSQWGQELDAEHLQIQNYGGCYRPRGIRVNHFFKSTLNEDEVLIGQFWHPIPLATGKPFDNSDF